MINTTISPKDLWKFESIVNFNSINIDGLSGSDGILYLNNINILSILSSISSDLVTYSDSISGNLEILSDYIGSVSGNWENTYILVSTLSSAWGTLTATTNYLSGLQDVTINVPISTNDVLIYNGETFINRRLRSADIGANFAISNFGTAQTLEIGATSIDPQFTATYAYNITEAGIKDNNGHILQNISPPATTFTYLVTNTKTTINNTVTFTLTATDTTLVDSDAVIFRWCPNVYWGVDTTPVLTENFIKNLSNASLESSRNNNINYNVENLQYACYAIPSVFGTPTFTVGVLQGGFTLLGTVSLTNDYGITNNYDLWRSDNHSLGNIEVVVT